jgi:hypothetical protein
MRMRTIILFGVVLITADILDLLSTYLATPDLAREFNPLVRYLGFGWGHVFFIHAVVLGILLFGLIYCNRLEPGPTERPDDADNLTRTFIWYSTGLSASDRQVQPTRYLGFLFFFIPLGSIINSICNTVLNLSFYFGYFDGLDDSTIWIYRTIKMTLIFVGAGTITYLYLKRKYFARERLDTQF